MKQSANIWINTGKAIILPCLLASGCGKQTQKQEQDQDKKGEKPNIIMFYTDDNAFWYWGFGGGPNLSPDIDQIAQNGVECTQFYAVSSVSTPSRYNLQTGKYAGRCQSKSFLEANPVSGQYAINWNTQLHDSKETTIADIFRKGGYKTGYVGKWHLGYDVNKFRFDPDADPSNPAVAQKLQDFQEYAQNIIKEKGYDYAASIVPSNNDAHPVKALQYHNLEWTAKGAIDFIQKCSKNNEPFFLLINITTHHGPCHTESLKQPVKVTAAGYKDNLKGLMPPRSTVFDRIEKAGYDADFKTTGTVWTNDLVRSVMDSLKTAGLYEESAVVFTTDHNRYDGKATCYQGGVHIPFVMQYPGVIPEGSKCNTRFQMTDLFPTFMDMCQITIPDTLYMDGKSHWPAIKGDTQNQKEHQSLYFEFGYTRAILDGDYKYIALRYPDPLIQKMKNGVIDKAYSYTGSIGIFPNPLRYPHYFDPDQLYNIKNDYEEQNNLAYNPRYKDKLDSLKQKLHAYLESFDHPFPLHEVDSFYYSQKYKELSKNARDNMNMEQFYWYKKECY